MMKSERVQSWVSRLRGNRGEPAGEVADIPVGLVVAESGPALESNERRDTVRRTLGIIALVVFAPIIVIVVIKVLRDMLSSRR